ncbi:RNA methyltransferase [Aureimonas sp. Leaf454]|uniref:class I SAM-dependent RNA methyltransferase n=1 Tax=Aureimonas sp. Leaf454 TaxID=1736381 RepID=UPI0006FB3788|nr:class I SAM-dependent RNA methyltransferase [Aureimonas sp. Leaf454]KQT54712.1 RNA methyltransferase [Aureimonas sp. Leaf454]
MTLTLEIDELGAKGDGVATGPENAPLYVPFTLPGERVEAERSGARAKLLRIELASKDRVEPPCPHFGICGGCDLQHADDALYRDFKRRLVVSALKSRGIETEIAPLVTIPPATRRRAVFSGLREGNRIVFGFFEALTNRIVPIETCLVVVPEIERRLNDLRSLALIVADRKGPMRMVVTASDVGFDIALSETAKATEALRQSIVAFALRQDFARVTLDGETVMETRRPTVDVARITVPLPPGGFLQASAQAEEAMASLVTRHLAGSKAVADLFSGIGTFALRLARSSAVHAVETDALALASLDAARRKAQGLKPLTTERRDLFRRPMTAKDLSRFEGVVFDPPRAGAEAQCHELALSKVRRVAAVSCNPATLARDLRILLDGGFRLVGLTPIDQFVWSHHVEAVALLER